MADIGQIGDLVVGLTMAAGSYKAGLAEAGAATDKTTAGMKQGLGGASKSGDQFNAVLKEMGLGSLTTIASVAGVTGAVIGMGKAAYDSIKGWSALATQVEDYSRLTHTGAEDSSRLIESTGDLGISFESLEKAMEAASRNGLDTSITGVKNLSEQYLKLNPGQERAKFLMDNLGKSGEDLAKYMELGAAGIDKVTKAVGGAKIVTEAQIELNKKLKASQNDFNDVFENTKLQIGGALAGPFTGLLTWYNKSQTANVETGTSWLGWVPILGTVTQAIRIHTQSLKDDKDAAAAASDAAIAQGVQNIADSYTGLAARYDAAAVSQSNLNIVVQHGTQDYWDYIPAVNQANAAVNDITFSIDTVSGSFDTWSASMIYNKLAVEGADQANMALAVSLGLIDSTALVAASGIDLITQGIWKQADAAKQVLDYENALQALKDKTITITTYLNTVLGASAPGIPTGGDSGTPAMPSGSPGPGMKWSWNGSFWTPIAARASGGSVQANIPVLVGERGPEIFNPGSNGSIIPNNQIGKMTVDWSGFPMDAFVLGIRDAMLKVSG
jgi:hypothetical protein